MSHELDVHGALTPVSIRWPGYGCAAVFVFRDGSVSYGINGDGVIYRRELGFRGGERAKRDVVAWMPAITAWRIWSRWEWE